MSLKQKTLINTGIVFGASVINRIINFISKIVLAILLKPSDFGLVGIAGFVINTLALFKEMGLEAALIYTKREIKKAADTAFIVLLIIAVLLSAIAFLSAPLVASFYEERLLSPIIRTLSLTFIFTALIIVPHALFTKELQFKKITMVQIFSASVGVSSTITLAYINFGVWSLVYGGLIGGFAGLILMYMVSDWRPNFSFDKEVAKELIGYGKFMFGTTMAVFFIQNLDNAVVGKVMGMSMLGAYIMAYSIANMPATGITNVTHIVTFPTYSKISDNRKDLRKAYLEVFKYISLFSIPLTFGILAISSEFITVVLKEKWLPAIPALQILCFFGLFRSLAGTTGEVFKAVGKPSILFKSYAAQLVAIVILLYPMTLWYGIIGTSITVTATLFFVMLWQLKKISEILEIRGIAIIKILTPCIAASLMMFLTLYLSYMYSGYNILYLILRIMAGFLVYSVSLYMLTKGEIWVDIKELKRLVTSRVKKYES
ncbi:MAG: lipopolysaccharide biosynthesis protein [Candidatus Marinimicrobia bacterium]|nr:lipopolysaccharide biosynthesis protein [Candidatus Neomarinimicrobiota bacterium]